MLNARVRVLGHGVTYMMFMQSCTHHTLGADLGVGVVEAFKAKFINNLVVVRKGMQPHGLPFLPLLTSMGGFCPRTFL